MTARAPSARALTTSEPRRIPPSMSTSSWPPTAWAIGWTIRSARGGAFGVVPAGVGDRDARAAGVHRTQRIVHPAHALEHEGRAAHLRPGLAHPRDVVPRRWRGGHPLVVRGAEGG